jgi:hypothetical protein
MLPALTVIIWEFALLAASTRVAMLLAACTGRKLTAEEFFAVVCSVNMALEALPATALSFAHGNSAAAYLAIAAGLVVFGMRPQVLREFADRWRALEIWRFRLTAAFLCAAAVPLLLVVWKPVDEWDSIHYLHYLLEWRVGQLTPYTFATNYVAFGPSRFLPGLVLARNDWFFWLVSLKPVLLLGLGLHLLAVELELPARLRIWTVAAAMALQHLWGCHSGVSTLKSDSLHAAGAVLLALVLMRAAGHRASLAAVGRPILAADPLSSGSGRLKAGCGQDCPPHNVGTDYTGQGIGKDCPGQDATFDPVLFAFALAFATEKYTGVFLGAFAVAGLLWMRIPWRELVPGMLLTLVTTGHYYIRSLWQHGNPFYPFAIKMGPIELPGTADLSATSILANARNGAMWRLFFLPAHGISPAGILFPAALLLILAASCWIVLRNWRRRPPAFWLACVVLLGWLLFARTFYGAGPQAGSLEFLQADLSTLRYVEGFLALGEILLIWSLWKLNVPVPVLMAMVAIEGASRLWLLYTQPNLLLFPARWWIAAAALAGLACFGLRAVAAGGLAALALAAAPLTVERNRAEWLPFWQGVYRPLWNAPAGSMFLFDEERAGADGAQFALSGAKLQHEIRLGTDLAGVSERYAVRVLDRGQLRSELDRFAAALEPRGYRRMVEAPQGIILEHVAAAGWESAGGTAWYVEDGTLPAAGAAIDAGDASGSRRVLHAGDLAFSPSGRVLRVGANSTTAPAPVEGVEIRLANAGNPPGLTYRFRDGRWTADRPGVPVPPSPIVSIEHGKFELERLQDANGPYLRVRALNDSAWLVVVTEFPPMVERAPFTALWVARAPAGSACTYWLWTKAEISDYSGGRTGDWQTFRLLRRAHDFARGDHLAVGRKNVHAGDSFDLREAGVLAGYFP